MNEAMDQEELSGQCWTVADFSPLPMAAVTGSSHVLCYVNPAFCRLLEATKQELTGRLFAEAMQAEEECISLLDRVYRTGAAESYTAQTIDAPNPFYRSYVMWPLNGTGGHRAGVMIELTETTPFHVQTTAMNEALMLSSVRQHELTEEAGKLNAGLQRANDDLNQFAFAASHDLQEPLRMITNYAQLLILGYRDKLDGDAEMCVRFINDGARHMRALLADLLSYAEVDAQGSETHEPVDMNMVLAGVMQNLSLAVEESGTVITSASLPLVAGPEVHLVQLLQNLIGNAIKYRGPAEPRIDIAVEQQGSEWLFAVKDNGMGIAPEYQQKIFGIFTRLHGKSVPGTGIGLAICQRVVQRHGGRIWVASELGQGTTFYFTLPALPRQRRSE